MDRETDAKEWDDGRKDKKGARESASAKEK